MKTIQLTGQPIMQLGYDDLQRIVQNMVEDRMLSRESAAQLLDVSPQTIDSFREKGLIKKYYVNDPGAVKPLSRYKYSELMGIWGKNRVL